MAASQRQAYNALLYGASTKHNEVKCRMFHWGMWEMVCATRVDYFIELVYWQHTDGYQRA